MSNDLNLDNLTEKVEDEIEKFLTRVLLKIESDSVRIIDSNRKIAWGLLREGITHTVYREAAKIVGIVGVKENVASVSHVMGEDGYSKKFPYAMAVHEGTVPHWPPQIAIQAWVVRKGILRISKKPTTLGRLQKSKRKDFDPFLRELRQISFLIARKISKQGTKGLPFLRMALNQNRSWIESELNKVKFT